MMLIGFGFKVATVPFHMWAPDVYEGAPSPITAYMAATVKAAAFAAFIRVWLEAFPSAFAAWHPALSGLAIATMVFGNAIGLAQKNLKRLLAYSSIGHAGYLLVAIAAGTFQGSSAMLFYLFVYTLATFGAFAVVVMLTREGETRRHDRRSPGSVVACVRGLPLSMAVHHARAARLPDLRRRRLLREVVRAPGGAAGAGAADDARRGARRSRRSLSAGYYLYVVMVMFMRPRPEERRASNAPAA